MNWAVLPLPWIPAGETLARMLDTETSAAFLHSLREKIAREVVLSQEEAERILTDPDLPLADVLSLGEIPRKKHYRNQVMIHILNNVQNGHCSEDCAYCAQRKGAEEEVPSYGLKPEEEILAEARAARDSGAYRYCLVTSGRGPSPAFAEKLARVIRRIKEEYRLEVCLSAGLIRNAAIARSLAEAGLDRYNHNLNTSEEHYKEICTTHEYGDRAATLGNMKEAGVELCSGVIVGMGESPRDLAQTALELRRLSVASIPVNFFLPIPGHEVRPAGKLDASYCLRVLAMFRLTNPRAEIRMAAGREYYLGERQAEALRVANSLFVSGYLNVKGSDAEETLAMLTSLGYESAGDLGSEPSQPGDSRDESNRAEDLRMKSRAELRPESRENKSERSE